MKIVRPTEVTVTFVNAQEASRYLYAYYAGAGLERLGFPILTSNKAEDVAARHAAAHAAVEYLAGGTAVEADPQHAAPTYISGSSDRVYLISEMPTRYIRNVLAMDVDRQRTGLVRAMHDELRRRGEKPWA